MNTAADEPGVQSSRIFVGGLFEGVTEDALKEKLTRFGEVTSVDIKVKEGSSGNTKFAFVEMKASPASVTKCLTTFSNTVWKGNTLKLQLAKEGFLARLQKERDARSNNSGPPVSGGFKSCNMEPRGRHKTINFDSFSETPFENKRRRRQDDEIGNSNDVGQFSSGSNKTPFIRDKRPTARYDDSAVDDNVVEPTPPSNFVFLDRLEKFSSGVWNDEDTFEVVTEDYTLKPMNTVEDNEDDEEAVHNNLVNLQKRPLEQHPRAKCVKTAHSPSVPEINADSSRKHFLSNERRLQTLDEKLTASKLQQSLVKAALLNADSSWNKKIVFGPDDEYAENGDVVPKVEKEINNGRSKKFMLFEDDQFEVDNDDTYDDAEATFRFKSQFQGESGRKLLELQSHYGNDPRFNIDRRFVEGEQDVKEPLRCAKKFNGPDGFHEDERLRNFNVLESVLGYQLEGPRDGDARSNTKHWTEMIPERYDPAREGHEKYEIHRSSENLQPLKLPAKKAKQLRKKQEKQKKLALPEVSNERFFEVEENLADAFKKNPDTGMFSLSKIFESTNHGVARDDFNFDANMGSSGPRTYWTSNPFAYDSSSGEEGESERRDHQSNDSKWVDHDQKGLKAEKSELATSAKRQTFFLFKDDPRLNEGAESFRRHEDIETITEKWRSTRAELIHQVKMKCKHLMGKIAKSQKRYKQYNKRSASRKFMRPKQQQNNRRMGRRNRGGAREQRSSR